MKNTFLAIGFFVFSTIAAIAQPATSEQKPVKIGYTNANYIFSISPKAKEIESEIKSRSIQLRKEIEKKEDEFRSKYEEYEKGKTTMMESIRRSKEDELRSLEQLVMNLRQNAETEIKNKSEELVAPESERIQKAIKEVADANGYTFVLNGDPQILLYGVESANITDLVLKKLGITAPAPGAENAAPANNANPEPAKPIMANPNKGKGTPKKK